MANISSWLGTQAHGSLLTASTYNASSHLVGGAAVGAGLGFGSALYNNTGTPVSDAVDTAMKGALVGAGTRFASARYAEGAFRNTMANHMGFVTPELTRRNSALSAQSHNFSFSNFTTGQNSSFWNADPTVSNNITSASFMSRYRG